ERIAHTRAPSGAVALACRAARLEPDAHQRDALDVSGQRARNPGRDCPLDRLFRRDGPLSEVLPQWLREWALGSNQRPPRVNPAQRWRPTACRYTRPL